ncbi:Peroxisomal membrane protein [Yarrowia sp. C11]|nr:Peroxisomal membrane protein [Yarrowia sp. C11]KAG5364141.1 Peroxisomal membrane protein [Yarrowia sp. E02]
MTSTVALAEPLSSQRNLKAISLAFHNQNDDENLSLRPVYSHDSDISKASSSRSDFSSSGISSKDHKDIVEELRGGKVADSDGNVLGDASDSELDTDGPEPLNPRAKLSVKLMDKMLALALPPKSAAVAKRVQIQEGKDRFSMNLMGKNFRGVTSRFTIIYETYYTVLEILMWKRPTFTLGVMAIYSFICLHPRLLFITPLAYILFCVMVPAYVSRHYDVQENYLTTQWPTIEPKIPAPAPEFSRDFYINMVDTQNSMTDFIRTYDIVAGILAHLIYFEGDESLSAAIYAVGMVGVAVFYVYGDTILRIMPWRFFFFVFGWAVILLLNPMLHRMALREYNKLPADTREKLTPEKLKEVIDELARDEFLYHTHDDVRTIEVFELQELDLNSRQWKTATYVAHPHIPSMLHEPNNYAEADNLGLSPTTSHSSSADSESRIQPQSRYTNGMPDRTFSPPPATMGEAIRSIQEEVSMATYGVSSLYQIPPPPGVYSIDEVVPPKGWIFLEVPERDMLSSLPKSSDWEMDYLPEQWVAWWGAWKKYLEIDQDEKWVYDILPDGFRGTWRRRRWTSLCKRKSYLKKDVVGRVGERRHLD